MTFTKQHTTKQEGTQVAHQNNLLTTKLLIYLLIVLIFSKWGEPPYFSGLKIEAHGKKEAAQLAGALRATTTGLTPMVLWKRPLSRFIQFLASSRPAPKSTWAASWNW